MLLKDVLKTKKIFLDIHCNRIDILEPNGNVYFWVPLTNNEEQIFISDIRLISDLELSSKVSMWYFYKYITIKELNKLLK